MAGPSWSASLENVCPFIGSRNRRASACFCGPKAKAAAQQFQNDPVAELRQCLGWFLRIWPQTHKSMLFRTSLMYSIRGFFGRNPRACIKVRRVKWPCASLWLIALRFQAWLWHRVLLVTLSLKTLQNLKETSRNRSPRGTKKTQLFFQVPMGWRAARTLRQLSVDTTQRMHFNVAPGCRICC